MNDAVFTPFSAMVGVAMFFAILGVLPERHPWWKRICLAIAGGLLWPLSMILVAIYFWEPDEKDKKDDEAG